LSGGHRELGHNRRDAKDDNGRVVEAQTINPRTHLVSQPPQWHNTSTKDKTCRIARTMDSPGTYILSRKQSGFSALAIYSVPVPIQTLADVFVCRARTGMARYCDNIQARNIRRVVPEGFSH
tara:strand:- start:947 stop:1312 length:366 start_codon:yes stop_codon:yes gene_type:complete